MAVRTTRQSMAEIKMFAKNEDIVVIPGELLRSLLESYTKQQDAIIQINSTMGKFINEFSNAAKENERLRSQLHNSLDSIARNVNNETAPSENFQQKLLTKLDALNQLLASKNSSTNEQIKVELKKSADRRNALLSKTLRAEKLSKYYAELIDRPDPFVPHMYRSKINKSTPEFEKEHYKQFAIRRVGSEIKLLEMRVKNWKTQISDLESSINVAASSLEDSERKAFYSRVSKNEEETKRFRAEGFEKLRRSYDDEINSGANKDLFLLTLAERQRNRYVKNKRRRSQGWSNEQHYNGHWT